MPDHVDPASLAQGAAGNVVDGGNADHADSTVPLPTDSPFGAMDKVMTSQEGAVNARRSKRPPVVVLWLVVIAVVIVDQTPKQWVFSALSDGRHTTLFNRALGLVLMRNPGAAFSFATGQTRTFVLIVSYAIAITIRVSWNLASGSWAVTLDLVLDDAVGNLIDHLLREPDSLRDHVIDFIDYGGYFVGNVTDIAIVAATAGITILSLGGRETDGTRAGTSDNPEVEGGGIPPSSTCRGVRAHGKDCVETSSEPEEPLDAST